MRVLRVGDPHIRPSNITEAHKLMEFVRETAYTNKVDQIEILGDLFHTHAVIRLEVLEFWAEWLPNLSKHHRLIVLVGNHDMSGDHSSNSNALSVFKDMENERFKIVDAPYRSGVFGYLPYKHSNADFLEEGRKLFSSGCRTLVCHATFSGSQYDNGFFAPNGVNPDDLPFSTIISGHIHKEQIIAGGKVDYPGTPKWDTASDANERKGIWLYEHDDSTGVVTQRNFISTEKVCTPIVSFVWLEGEEQPVIPEGSRATVELVGSGDWVANKKSTLKGKVGIKSKITDKKRSESRKAGNSFENYLANLYVSTMDREHLLAYAKELGIV